MEKGNQTMSTQPTAQPMNQPRFTPIHRTVELENIHEQVTQLADSQQVTTSKRNVLMKCVTVIGDGSDVDKCEIITQ